MDAGLGPCLTEMADRPVFVIPGRSESHQTQVLTVLTLSAIEGAIPEPVALLCLLNIPHFQHTNTPTSEKLLKATNTLGRMHVST